MSSTANSVTFNVPTSFDSDNAGRVMFIPDTTGFAEIELELADKVKSSTKSANTFFFSNLAPQARFTTSLESNIAPYDVEVDASASRDRDAGSIRFYHWDFGDGSAMQKTQSSTFQHKYQKAGQYSIKLIVEDDQGALDSTEQAITTNNQAPLAALQVTPLNGSAPHQVQFTATNSIDPDGRIVSYRIDFDVGESTLDSVGVHTFQADGTYQVRLTVTDNLNLTATANVSVEVATPPIADLVITPETGPFPLEARIDASGSRDPQNGEVEVDIFIDNQLVYNNISTVMHTFNDPGNFQVRIVATNKRNNLTAEINKSVIPVNLDPVADFRWFPDSVIQNTLVAYDSESVDPNTTDNISYYRWTFPDGTVEGEDLAHVERLFNAGFNPYEVTLEVWDKFRNGQFEGYSSVTYTIPVK